MAARATSRMIQAGLIVKSRGLKSKCLQLPSPKQKHDECMDVIDWVFGFSRWVMFHHRHHQLPLSTFVVDSFVDSNVGSCWVMLGHHVGFMASWLHYASIFDGAGQAGRRFPPPTRLRAVLGRGEARSDRFGGLK